MPESSLRVPRGYRFYGGHAGIRPDPTRKDLALLVSDLPAAAAGTYTQNRVFAAPVQVSRERTPRESARGVVVCSGNANACTGEQGLADARRMTQLAAEELGCPEADVLVCSTGIIGRPLPMHAVESGIREGVRQLRGDPAAFAEAAEAILTTDTHSKTAWRSFHLDGREICVAGMAKGAAMIGPNMATMLAFVLTDAALPVEPMQRRLRQAVDRTFNCISVEGHMSTNDTVLWLANGAAGGPVLSGAAFDVCCGAVADVCAELARAIANDAEGLTHLVTIEVHGLPTDADARKVAKCIAESVLVKTALFGADPNWGRIVSAAGYAGVEFDPKELSLWLGNTLLYDRGVPVPFDPAALSRFLKSHREITLKLWFARGAGQCRFWTCDLGYEYVRLNAEYTT